MSYFNITCSTTKNAEQYVDENWVRSRETTFMKKHVLARGAHLLLTPASFITCAVDTIIGLGAGIGAICTVGKYKPLIKFACLHAGMSNNLLIFPYQNFLQAINPEAKFGNCSGYFVASKVSSLIRIARRFEGSNNLFKRHVASRLTYALIAISRIVTRAVDGIISIPVVALSILTVGKFEFINNLASKTLKGPGIINDLFECTMMCINPWTSI